MSVHPDSVEYDLDAACFIFVLDDIGMSSCEATDYLIQECGFSLIESSQYKCLLIDQMSKTWKEKWLKQYD